MRTGSSSATGVRTPVRPTWMVMSLKGGFLLFGEELVGGGPAGGAGGLAEGFAFGAVEDFDDDSVGGVVEVVAVGAVESDALEQFLEVFGDADGLVARDGNGIRTGRGNRFPIPVASPS